MRCISSELPNSLNLSFSFVNPLITSTTNHKNQTLSRLKYEVLMVLVSSRRALFQPESIFPLPSPFFAPVPTFVVVVDSTTFYEQDKK